MAARGRRLAGAVNWLGLGVLAGLLAAWQLAVAAGALDAHALPGPLGILDGLRDLAATDALWPRLRHTLTAVLLAWAIAVAAGGVGGLLLGSSPTVAAWTGASVDVLRSLPVLALIPIAVLVWGPAMRTEVAVAAYAAVWPMLVTTAGGARTAAPRLRDVARTLRLSRADTVLKVLMPQAGVAMVVGARLALGIALVVCVVAEMLGTPLGIGAGLIAEQAADQPERMWAYVAVVGLLGVGLNAALVAVTRVAFPGVARLADRERAG